MVRVRAKIEKNTLFGRVLVRVRAKIEKKNLFGRALVRIWAKIEKNTPLVWLLLVFLPKYNYLGASRKITMLKLTKKLKYVLTYGLDKL